MMKPEVPEAAVRDAGEDFRHAIDEWLDADESDPGVAFGLRHQMFAAAETRFQPHLRGGVEQSAQVVRRRHSEIERKLRQQLVHQRRLPRLERVSLAAAEKSARFLLRPVHQHHRHTRP
jgi:hypothetical protein